MIPTCQLLTISARSPTLCFEKEALEFRAVSTFWDAKQHAWMNPQTPSPKKKNMPGFQKTYFFVGQVILTKLDRRSVGFSHGPPVILEPLSLSLRKRLFRCCLLTATGKTSKLPFVRRQSTAFCAGIIPWAIPLGDLNQRFRLGMNGWFFTIWVCVAVGYGSIDGT
jgi:hypothetical protein